MPDDMTRGIRASSGKTERDRYVWCSGGYALRLALMHLHHVPPAACLRELLLLPALRMDSFKEPTSALFGSQPAASVVALARR